MKFHRAFTLIAAALTVAGAHAVPARPGAVALTAADGRTVTASLHGDEYCHWAVTAEGDTLLPGADGRWRPARRGELAAAGRSASRVRRAASTQIEGTFPAKGKHRLLTLLINYADTQPKYTRADFDRLMNGDEGSFRHYYLENSYGALDITTTVVRWVTLSSGKHTYGSGGAEDMIVEALRALDAEIDLRDFDNDGDGVLDGLTVVHQGHGRESTANADDIWSHSGMIYGESFDGIQLGRYTIVPELLDASISTIGVVCHEFGHNLGAPDFYDTDYESSGGEYPGTGEWDLMAKGAWNGVPDGSRPSGTNMWQKIQLGWVSPTVLSSDCHIDAMPSATTHPVAYRFDTTEPGEYFILENRQQTGFFDSALPSHGLIVYHADDNRIAAAVEPNTVNNTFPQAMYTVCAGAGCDPKGLPEGGPSSYGAVNSGAAPFPGMFTTTEFGDYTLPSTRSISGRFTYKGLRSIAESADGTISFDFRCYDEPGRPAGLRATVNGGTVRLDWDVPAVTPAPVRYTVYRGDVALASVNTPGYEDTDPAGSNMTYKVDAVYADGMVSPPETVRVFMPVNIITALESTADGGDVTLDWTLERRLSRMTAFDADFTTSSVISPVVELAHRYRASDLAVYRGYKIARVCLVNLQSQRDVTVTVSVYEVDPVTGARTLATQRMLTEYATNTPDDIRLLKSVEITGDKDIWVAVKYESKTGSVQFLTDNGPAVSGYGNLVSVDGGEWHTDDALPGNHYFYATLTAPSPAEAPMTAMLPATDTHADLALPLGFAVYRDGRRVATCGGTRYVDRDVPTGTHEYRVTCLFRGDNESRGERTTADVYNAGLADASAEPAWDAIGADGSLRLTGAAAAVTVTDLTGRSVAVTAAPATISLPRGIYIVSAPGRALKVAVR